MKKLFTLITALVMLLSITTLSYADANDEYHFELNYEGDIIENVAKSGTVLLVGREGQLYTNVRIKISGTGPAQPRVVAYDENGNEFDMAQNEYWGPASGFAIQGTFTNETPVTIIYPEAGTYTTTLQLIDVANNNAVIVSNEFTINVLSADAANDNGFEDPEAMPNEEDNVEELPQAGINLLQCSAYLLIIAIVFFVILRKKENK